MGSSQRGMEPPGTLDISMKTMAFLGDRRWSQMAKQEAEKMCKGFYAMYGRRDERSKCSSVSIFTRDRALSQRHGGH